MIIVGPEKGLFLKAFFCPCDLLGAGVLGDCFGAFRDGVLSKFTGRDEVNGHFGFPDW